MGTPQAAVPSLQRCLSDGHQVAAVYTQPDRPSGRGNKVTYSPVKDCALQNDIPVFQPFKIKTDEALAEFRSHEADLAVVVAYGRILPESFLRAFPRGAINVHFSLLPKYRGAAPVNWAIVNGEKITGVTTMTMDIGLDTGDILLQQEVEIGPAETSVELMTRLSGLGAELLSETLRNIDMIVPVSQNSIDATYAPIMNRDDGRIDWQMPAKSIVDRVRGFQPFPTAFTRFRDNKITIWQASETMVDVGPLGLPGEIIGVERDRLIIKCGGTSVLQVTEMQLEGKRRMAVRDIINGMQPMAGEMFGSNE